MKQLLLSAILLIVIGPVALAQTAETPVASAQAGSGYYRWEGYVGYSNLYRLNEFRVFTEELDGKVSVSGIKQTHRLLKGFEISGTRNLQRYFGVKADFSRHSDTRNTLTEVRPLVVQSLPLTLTNYQFLFGGQLKDNDKTKKFKPFAHVLGGQSLNGEDFVLPIVTGPDMFVSQVFRDFDGRWVGNLGGGLDVKLNDRLDIRTVQIDYSQANGGQQKQIRLGAGLVFH